MSEIVEPTYFGDVERPLFGWLHRPAQATIAAIGLLVCSPLGYEAVCAHRSLKHFASTAAADGIPALRFDYDGTGDSAGTDLDPDRVDAWVRSIHAAIETLKAHAGVRQVALLGVRLGATLSALVASQRSDIAGLAVIAPVVMPKGYLRELRALALARPQPPPPPGVVVDPDLQESAGFTVSSQTRTQLMGIDLMKLERAPANVLIIERDDMPGYDAWRDKLLALGANVQSHRLPGFTEMMLDSHETVIPWSMIDATREWLRQLTDAPAATAVPTPVPGLLNRALFQSDEGSSVAMEQAVFMGAERLFGIVTTPVPGQGAHPPTTAVMLLNSGAVHHIGPNRLYVTLARRWAAQGLVVLRLDLSGLGDSAPRAGEEENIVYSKRANEDVRAAMEFLTSEYGITDIHAIGLCSGGYHGFKSAVAGAPLRTVVSINPLTFNWKEGTSLAFPEYRVAQDVMRYKTNAFQWASWKKLLTGGVDIPELLQVLLRRAVSVTTNFVKDVAHRLSIPLPDDLGTELAALSKRDVNLLFVFANGEPGIDLLKSGGGYVVQRLRAHRKLDIQMIDGADHTFTSRWTREQLVEVLSTHVGRWNGH
jgi:alpha-beta hydrolase superfamily lysophospholipase